MVKPAQRRLFFIGLALIVILRAIVLLPTAMDFRNFAFRDLGSFQHVDALIGQGLRPGMDFGFYYGLLGVLLQHLCFALFGAGYWPTFGLLAIYLILMLVFWNLICREAGESLANFCTVFGLSGLIIYIEPWPPTAAHILLILSLAFSLYFTLKRRLATALLIATLGTLSIPSLPIVLTGLLALTIAWEWWQTPGRTVRGLLTQYVPAVVAYIAAVTVMMGFFGWRSVLPSLVPLHGAAVYHAMNYGIFARGRRFWYPGVLQLGYYLFTSAGVWLVCSALLVVFGCIAAARAIRAGKAPARSLFILFCCVLHLVFVFAAFGNEKSYVYYSFVLCAGVVAGVSDLTNNRLRSGIGVLLLAMGLLSQRDEIGEGLSTWRTGSLSPDTASLFAPRDFQAEWKSVLALAGKRRVFLRAYGTGVDLYYPRIGTAQSWMLLPAVLVPGEHAFVLRNIRSADVIVEKLVDSSMYDKEWRVAIDDFPIKVLGKHFLVWTRADADRADLLRTTNFRPD